MRLLRGAAAGCLFALAAFAPGCSEAPESPPDVVLVTVDTLRADRLGAYGYSETETPAMDGLAARGQTFRRAVTPMPRTTPGLASLLTGLLPHRHGSREVGRPVAGPESVTLLSEILTDRGYYAAAVSANGAAGPGQGLDRGFARFVPAGDLAGLRAEDVTDRALELAAEAPADAPLFLWVHYIDPHAPYDPPSPWGDDPAGEACRELARRAEAEGWEGGHLFSDRDGASSRALASCSALYDAEVRYTDHHLGRLLDALDRLRNLDDALVILTADHGENLGEQGLFYQHGPSLHDASLRVPWIWAGPGVPEGEVVDEPVRLEDVLPTLLAHLELPVPEGLDGRDVGPSRRGMELVRAEAGSALMEHNTRYLFSGRAAGFHCFNGPRFSLCTAPERGYELFDRQVDPDFENDVSDRYPDAAARLRGVAGRWPPEEVRERAVGDGRFKLVERPMASGGHRRFLFDRVEDPAEETNVAGRHPDVVRRLGPVLDRFAAELPRQAPPERSTEELEALEALGYVR